MHVGLHAKRHDRRSSIRYSVNEIAYVATAHLGNSAMAPRWNQFAINSPLDVSQRLILGLVALQPVANNTFKINTRCLTLTDLCGISPCRHVLTGLAPRLPSLSKRHGGISPERHATEFAPDAVEVHKAFPAAIGDA